MSSFLPAAGVATPLRRGHTGPNPADHGKRGSKPYLLVDPKGMPSEVCVTGANRRLGRV